MLVWLVKSHELRSTKRETARAMENQPGNSNPVSDIVGPREEHVGDEAIGAILLKSFLERGFKQIDSFQEFGE